jgi:hypothetical protein
VARVETFEEYPREGYVGPVFERRRLHFPGRLRTRSAAQVESVTLTRRMRVHRLHLWSVAKLAFITFFCIGVMIAFGLWLLWVGLNAAGVVPNLEKFIREVAGVNDFHFRAGVMFRSALLAIGSFVFAATSMTVVAASFYNLLAPLVGGLDVDMCEDVSAPAEHNAAERPAPVKASSDVDLNAGWM